MITASLTLLEQHFDYLRKNLIRSDGVERAAYVLCGEAHIESEPWDGQPHRKFVSHEILSVPEEDIVSCSSTHITWTTDSLVKALKLAQNKKLTVAIFHSHPKGMAGFSAQDDANEPDLLELAQNRNGLNTQLLSVILTPDGGFIGRLWISQQICIPLRMIRIIGSSIDLHYPERGRGVSTPAFHRQALAFGEALNQDLSMLRVGVVGCGGTGSAIAMLLPKLGFRNIALFDKDIVEETNLNRLYGACQKDIGHPKVEVIARSLTELGLGMKVKCDSLISESR